MMHAMTVAFLIPPTVATDITSISIGDYVSSFMECSRSGQIYSNKKLMDNKVLHWSDMIFTILMHSLLADNSPR